MRWTIKVKEHVERRGGHCGIQSVEFDQEINY